MSDEELDLVPTEELVQALRRRTKAVVIVELQDLSRTTESHCAWFGGGRITCLGLIEQARLELLSQAPIAKKEEYP